MTKIKLEKSRSDEGGRALSIENSQKVVQIYQSQSRFYCIVEFTQMSMLAFAYVRICMCMTVHLQDCNCFAIYM
jgi:hypothetical protein